MRNLHPRLEGLRALLIQKDTKLASAILSMVLSLRALLIQKDTKPSLSGIQIGTSLRALLIQKDTKQKRMS